MVWWFGGLSPSNSSITAASLPRNEFDSASDSLVDFRTGQGLQKADVRLLRDGERVGGAETVACFGACVRLDCMLPQEGGAGDASGDTPSVPASGASIRLRTPAPAPASSSSNTSYVREQRLRWLGVGGTGSAAQPVELPDSDDE